MEKVLGKLVQVGVEGHDSKEDAVACIELVMGYLQGKRMP